MTDNHLINTWVNTVRLSSVYYSITPNMFVRHMYVTRIYYALLIRLYTLAEALGWGLCLYYWRPGGTKDRPTFATSTSVI